MQMHTITLQVPQSTLDNFKKVVESETGFEVTDPLTLLTASLTADTNGGSDAYAYMVAESDCIYEEDWPGLKK